ncbi:CaiB/BaiF CoA transferase family protein [Phenylobacterium sp.]|uniref:CaiB/BaiF CoA transferase family protein n=1 Tax=Phenylobacterium sp. TaxID=1871053 RepID=UPI001211D808|nr:CoA transferase [Phenylobacterium sp.]TAL28761.1 MAG: CoA transferase [Phenylobacterium sp.]
MSTGLFSDLLVVDCASFIAGPAAATVLSDFGARVIKIEPPGIGDAYRNLFRLRGTPDDVDYFWALDSRNKESLALDLRRAEAQAVLRTLVRKADVFITNIPFPARERLGVRAQDLMPLNSRLIYASLTPYGEHGPERDRTGFDATVWWARSGLMDLVRPTAGAEPAISMPGMGDHPTAMAMYGAILTALYKRQLTGEGSEVSTSLLANGLWANGCQVQAALCGYELAPRPKRGDRGALNEMYRASDDRHFIIVSTNPARDWPLLAKAVGHAEWLEDPLFATPEARLMNGPDLVARFDATFAEHPYEHWSKILSEGDVTFGIVATIYDHFTDGQIEANGLFPEFSDHWLRTVDSPFQVQGEAKLPPRMAPDIGQHTRALLAEFGCSPAEIEALAVD